MKPVVLRYGLLIGTLIGLWVLCSFSIVDWLNRSFFQNRLAAAHVRSVSGLFSTLILICGIYLGIKKTRQREGSLNFQQAVKTGTIIATISAILVTAFTVLYVTVINPGFPEFMVSDAARSMTAAGKKPEEIKLELISVRKMFSPGMQVMQAFVGQLVVGILASLILGAVMRSRKAV